MPCEYNIKIGHCSQWSLQPVINGASRFSHPEASQLNALPPTISHASSSRPCANGFWPVSRTAKTWVVSPSVAIEIQGIQCQLTPTNEYIDGVAPRLQ